MDLVDAVNSTKFTVFVVASITVTAGDSYILSGYDVTDAGNGYDGSNRFRIANYNNNGKFSFRMGAKSFDPVDYDANAHSFAMEFGGGLATTVDVWVDDTKTTGDADVPNLRLGVIQVSPEDPKGFLLGEVTEVILYDTALTDTEIESVNAYLHSKYFATVGIEDIVNNVNLKVYPNPTASNVTIKADNGFVTGP